MQYVTNTGMRLPHLKQYVTHTSLIWCKMRQIGHDPLNWNNIWQVRGYDRPHFTHFGTNTGVQPLHLTRYVTNTSLSHVCVAFCFTYLTDWSHIWINDVVAHLKTHLFALFQQLDKNPGVPPFPFSTRLSTGTSTGTSSCYLFPQQRREREDGNGYHGLALVLLLYYSYYRAHNSNSSQYTSNYANTCPSHV
jgi:hypothetical protein